MFTINHQIRIERPLKEVFEFVADSRNDPRWCPPVIEVQQTKGSGPGPGAEYSFSTKPGPIKTTGSFRIVDFTPNERLYYEGENGIARFNYEYDFTADGENATSIRMSSTLAPKGFWRALQPMMHMASKKVTQEEFRNLKKLLEK